MDHAHVSVRHTRMDGRLLALVQIFVVCAIFQEVAVLLQELLFSQRYRSLALKQYVKQSVPGAFLLHGGQVIESFHTPLVSDAVGHKAQVQRLLKIVKVVHLIEAQRDLLIVDPVNNTLDAFLLFLADDLRAGALEYSDNIAG